jgi:hypothetical protein
MMMTPDIASRSTRSTGHDVSWAYSPDLFSPCPREGLVQAHAPHGAGYPRPARGRQGRDQPWQDLPGTQREIPSPDEASTCAQGRSAPGWVRQVRLPTAFSAASADSLAISDKVRESEWCPPGLVAAAERLGGQPTHVPITTRRGTQAAFTDVPKDGSVSLTIVPALPERRQAARHGRGDRPACRLFSGRADTTVELDHIGGCLEWLVTHWVDGFRNCPSY